MDRDPSQTTMRKNTTMMDGFLSVQGKGAFSDWALGDGGYEFGLPAVASVSDPWAAKRLSFALSDRRVMS